MVKGQNKGIKFKVRSRLWIISDSEYGSLQVIQCENMSGRAHHVPKLVKGNHKAGAHSPQSLKGPDVNFDPYPLLNTSVQLPQWTAFTY